MLSWQSTTDVGGDLMYLGESERAEGGARVSSPVREMPKLAAGTLFRTCRLPQCKVTRLGRASLV